MFSYRIIKYNPIYRNEQGAYSKDDWISISDIGKCFENKILSSEEYIKIETAYVNAILAFMKCLEIKSLVLTNLEKKFDPEKASLYPQEIIDQFYSIKNNQTLDVERVAIIAKLILRENIWGRFANEKMFVHFGYDYYMYIGSKKACPRTIFQIEQAGLFVEEFESPYLELPEEEQEEEIIIQTSLSKKDKRRIYELIDLFLSGKIDAWNFCDEYHTCYGLTLDLDSLTELEAKVFNELSQVSGRFSKFEEDHRSCPNAFSSEEELKKKVIETKEKLQNILHPMD